MDASGGDLQRARALGDPTRVAVLRLVEAAAVPVTVAELTTEMAEQLGIRVHHTAIRQHLAKLLAAGLVTETALPPSGRGRPRLAYRAAPGPEERADAPYRSLAGLLAEAVRTGRTAREVGRAAGARQAVTGSTLAAVLDATRSLGFEPTLIEPAPSDPTLIEASPDRHALDRVEVELQACPFADVAAEDPATICSLHLGLVEGLVSRGPGDLVVDGLDVRPPHDGGCVLRLHRPHAPPAPTARRPVRAQGT